MKKADYSKIAPLYDKGRTISEQNIDLWLRAIARLSRGSEGSKVLDLGCGTGRFSIPMAAKLGYRVTGADSSAEMLEVSREKDIEKRVAWDLQDAQDLSYPDKSFDIVFMSHLLHHCEYPDKVVRECHRVLSERGVIVIRYGAIEQIRHDAEHTFFPETLAIDEDRSITINMVEGWLQAAGFSGVVSEEIEQQTYETAEAHLEATRVKNTSVLTMISDRAYREGLERFQDYLEKNPPTSWLLYDRMTLTVGFKT